ncbi:hypothetical protein K3495_g7275 [Podosphaera aphanis]|nr:hypothetical protein K3495_g7275 [Podosphaera aphanis]
MNSNYGLQSSQDQKNVVMQQVRDEAAIANGKQLIEKVNENCFDKCIPKPGTSLSSAETSCLSQCMEKYLSTWSAVHRQYTNRIATEMGRGATGS